MRGGGGLGSWLRVQFFRLWTALATIVLVGLCFYYYPEWLQWYLRTSMRGIETAADRLPSAWVPWVAQAEVVLRTIGASIWFQFASAIVMFRVAMWALGRGSWWLVQRVRGGGAKPPERKSDTLALDDRQEPPLLR
jgi:hypothetical protein